MNTIEKFIEWAKKNDWDIERHDSFNLPDYILRRFSHIPKDYLDFLSKIKSCINKTDTVWFLCRRDFLNPPKEGFRWNEFEIMSLEEAGSLNDWKFQIRGFWDYHFPIVMSVGGVNYKYYAIDLTNNKDTVVFGQFPNFNNPSIVASDFIDFLEKIMEDKIDIN